jgi:hypothetical protein
MPKYSDETEGLELIRQFPDQVKGRICKFKLVH